MQTGVAQRGRHGARGAQEDRETPQGDRSPPEERRVRPARAGVHEGLIGPHCRDTEVLPRSRVVRNPVAAAGAEETPGDGKRREIGVAPAQLLARVPRGEAMRPPQTPPWLPRRNAAHQRTTQPATGGHRARLRQRRWSPPPRQNSGRHAVIKSG
ncbi:uncharacterized protein Tco025E_10163, partial [Trypanosoma conorhini]